VGGLGRGIKANVGKFEAALFYSYYFLQEKAVETTKQKEKRIEEKTFYSQGSSLTEKYTIF
jgi:hypothetical protein